MNPDLEALLKAFDAFHEASGSEARRLRSEYYARLADSSASVGASADTLDKLIRYKHGPWKLAQKGPPAIPPKA
jgi:hypothetical protein